MADLLLETGWTWADLEHTPAYIQRVVFDVIQARRRHEHEQAEQQRAEAEAAKRGH